MSAHFPRVGSIVLLATLLGGLASACSGGADDTASNGSSTGRAGKGGKGGSSAGGGGGGGEEGGTSGTSGGGGTGPVLTGGQGGSGGQTPSTCEPACVAPKTCGKSLVCLDPGTCAKDIDCESGKVCDASKKTCVPGSACGVTQIGVEQVEPNFLIVLDRSCSMTQMVNGKTKWASAVAALTKLTEDFKGKIRFGLTMFPDREGDSCSQGKIPVPVAPGAEVQIQQLLTKALTKGDMFFPNNPCVTNIDTGIAQAATEASFKDQTRDSFVMLVSDGAQSSSCGGNGADPITESEIKALFAQGVGTFAVGFGAGTDFAQMDKFAQAGGYPNPDPARDYYLAEDEASLIKAFTSIAKQTLGCTYKLKDVPDAGSIYVFFDKTKQIAQDTTHKKGWDYDEASQTVIFYGESCQDLKDGKVTGLDIVFGCPGNGGTVGVPPTCSSGIGCDQLHLCPNDPQKGAGFCDAGCCTFTKIE